jgi:pilus assembly protein FimV
MKLHLTALLMLVLLIVTPLSTVVANAQVTQIKGPKNATSQFSGSVYGPIDSADTLWRIADRYRQNKNLSVYQVMVAIYELNPDAFERENLNLLVDGATLKLPSERYIARIDKEAARQRAVQDERSWSRMENQPGNSLNNLKPAVPFVNQDDLFQTKSALEQQLNTLDSEQTRQFEALRNQFAASIGNIQALLDDNLKLYDRIDKIDKELTNFRTQLDEQVQPKFDEQLTLQRELRDLILEQKQAKEDAEKASLMNTLTSPLALIIGSAMLSLLVVVGGILWFLRRKSPSAEPAPEIIPTAEPEVEDDDSPFPDLASALDAELDSSVELSDDDLFNDDDLLDDVLSTELEEAIDDELDAFADLSEEMLTDDDNEFESGDSELDQDDLDSLFGEDDDVVSLEDEDNDVIELASDDELVPESANADALDAEQDKEQEIDTSDDVADLPHVDDDDEKPEISIDELLEETQKDEASVDPLGLNGENVDDEMLDRLDDEVNQQSQEIDRLTDNIINEIEQIELMGDMGLIDDDESDEEDIIDDEDLQAEPKLQDIDAITDDLDDIDVADIENADVFDDPLSDELLAELQAEALDDNEEELGDLDKPLDEDISPEDTISDELTDDILAELIDEDSQEASAENRQEDSESTSDFNDELADEILADLGVDGSDDLMDVVAYTEQDELADELIAELELDAELAANADDDANAELAEEIRAEAAVEEPMVTTSTEPDVDLDANVDEDVEQTPESVVDDNDDDDFAAILDELVEDDDAAFGTTSTPEAAEPDAAIGSEVEDDPLDQALADFDQELMEGIPSFTASDEPDVAPSNDTPAADYDDDILNQALDDFDDVDNFTLDQEVDGVAPDKPKATKAEVNELADVPGLDDWLTDSDEPTADTAILDELDNSEFDELMEAIEAESVDSPSEDKPEIPDKLDDPSLDLDALLHDPEDTKAEEDYVDVETLMEESLLQDEQPKEEPELDLDVSLSEFSGVQDDDDIFDIDKDTGQSANLDLARVYIEMEDNESAQELLLEVIELGSQEQKDEAQALLAGLTTPKADPAE